MNNKAFTLIEISVFIVVVGLILFGILSLPIDLFNLFNLVDKTSDIYSDTMIIDQSIKGDISLKPNSNNQVRDMIKDDKTLIINKSIYEFKNDGVYKRNKGKVTRLTRRRLDYLIIENWETNILKIYNKDIELEYNLNYINYLNYN